MDKAVEWLETSYDNALVVSRGPIQTPGDLKIFWGAGGDEDRVLYSDIKMEDPNDAEAFDMTGPLNVVIGRHMENW